MKRFFALLLCVILAIGLCGCGDDETAGTQPTPEPNEPAVTVTPTPVPTPVPTATPFPRIAAENYVLQWKNDTKRGFSYMIPTHWVPGESGDRYLTYYEPVPEGETGYRVSFANKKKSSEPDANVMKNELNKLLGDMGKVYKNFESTKITRDYYLVKFKGYNSSYSYTDQYGVKINGIVIIATYNRRIYMMNFSGPEARFEEMTPIGKKMMDSMTRVSTS